jgi:hypothetical protein
MLSDTRSAPEVSHSMRTLVGALHSTGVRGPVSDTNRGPGEAGVGAVVVEEELGGAVLDSGAGPVVVVELAGAVVEEAGAFAWGLLLLHAARSITRASAVSGTRRGRRTLRS